MSGERNARFLTFPADGDFSTGYQYRFAKLLGNEQVTRCDTQGEEAIGIIADNVAATGREMAVMTDVGSVFDITLGGTLTAGTRVGTDSQGRAIAISSDDVASLGVLLKGGDSGEIVPLLFQPLGKRETAVS